MTKRILFATSLAIITLVAHAQLLVDSLGSVQIGENATKHIRFDGNRGGQDASIKCYSNEKTVNVPLLVEGRRWSVAHCSFWPVYGDIASYETFTVKGTAIVGGKTYHEIETACYPEEIREPVIFYMRESEGMIFRLNTDMNGESLYFDYSISVGEKDPRGYAVSRIEEQDEGEDGTVRHYYYLDEYDPTYFLEFIEGIGYSDGSLAYKAEYTGSFSSLLCCHDADGHCRYGKEGHPCFFKGELQRNINDDNATGLSGHPANPGLSYPMLYDLTGRRLSDRPAKGVYIENGRKVCR